MKILVPVDGSVAADHAVESLVNYVSNLREIPQIEMMFAAAPVLPAVVVHGVAMDRGAIEAHYRNEADVATAKARQCLERAGLKFGLVCVQGDPPEEICRAAHAGAFDMIWMGTRGMGNFANLILGSVATKVLHGARVPVVMVPSHPEPRPAFPVNDFRT